MNTRRRATALFAFLLTPILALSMIPRPACAEASGDQKAVLVTGASSGIGRKITEQLATEGYFVYAGARKDKDLAELDAMENVQSVRLDVTVDADIEAAVTTVTEGGRGLYGLLIVDEHKAPGVDQDIALVLDDWRLKADGQIHAESFGSIGERAHGVTI